jgi:hypothetical protein
MLERLKKHATPATVISIIALVVALGGTAVAGGVLNKKKVNTIIDNRAPGLTVLKAQTAGKADNVFGATVNDGGTVTAATLPGTTANKVSNTFTYHFPRSVTGCIVTGSAWFDGQDTAIPSGTANPNDVIASNPSGTSNSVMVVCP